MESSFKAKPAQTISSATLQDRSDIAIEREQLLHHTERTAECTRCGDTDHDEGSTRCQVCGHDKFGPKQRCENVFHCSSARLTLTMNTVVTAKLNPSAPGFPKQTRKILKPEPASRSSHIEEFHCSYKFSSRLQYWYSIFL